MLGCWAALHESLQQLMQPVKLAQGELLQESIMSACTKAAEQLSQGSQVGPQEVVAAECALQVLVR